jgi:phosphoserine phosphatase
MQSAAFLQQVLSLRPRIAVFDCDGTLWANNSGDDFLEWSLDRRMVDDDRIRRMRARFEEYKEGRVDETVMCGEMVTLYAGLRISKLERAAREFFRSHVVPHYFEEMRSLATQLSQQGCELWAVSSTNEWVIREGVRDFAISAQNVIAASAHSRDGFATGELIRVPSGPKKADAIRELIRRPVDAVFGNSIYDREMLELAPWPFVINPNPDLEALAQAREWPIYWPEKTRAVAR